MKHPCLAVPFKVITDGLDTKEYESDLGFVFFES